MAKFYTAAEDDFLRQNVGEMSLAEMAWEMGRTKRSVQNRVWRLGLTNDTSWSDEEISALSQAYEAAAGGGVLCLKGLSAKLGRDRANICRKARQLGLETNQSRRKVHAPKVRRKTRDKDHLREVQSELAKRRISQNGHPRGMAGKKHSTETKLVLAKSSALRWSEMTEDEQSAFTLKSMKARAAKGGIAPKISRGKWRAGWREVGGKRIFFRSRWEANYGRYLQFLLERGEIQAWDHEPETFWFEKIKRGVRSYLPDFRVVERDGSSRLHEVKGWMDSRSKTTLSRMAKYHPQETIVLIGAKEYRKIEAAMAGVIAGWEGK
jgi:hypothetical protein